MTELMTGPFPMLFFIGVALLALAVPLWRTVTVYSGVNRRRPFDSSNLGLQPTGELGEVVEALRRLGFERLGEAQLDVPGVRAVELTASGHPRVSGSPVDRHTVFVMVDSGRTVVGEVSQVPHNRPQVSLNSIFGDASVVETMYPRGESIHDHDLHSGHNTRSLDRAYDDQRIEVDRWRLRHGPPRPINSMADYLRADATYREHYAKRTLRGPLIRRQLIPAAIAVAVVFVVAVALFTRWPA